MAKESLLYENLLPVDEQFDSILDDLDLKELIISRFAEYQGEVGDILDIDVEFSVDTLGLFKFSRLLASVPRGGTDDFSGRMRSTYRGLVFGLQLANELKSEKFNSIPTGSIFESLPRRDGMATDEAIAYVVRDYLSSRPAINGFLQVFSRIVNKGDYPELTKEASILMLMLVERQLGMQACEKVLDSSNPSNFFE